MRTRDDTNAAAIAARLNLVRLYAMGDIATGTVKPSLWRPESARKLKLAPNEAIFLVGPEWNRESVLAQFHRYQQLPRSPQDAMQRMGLRPGDICQLTIPPKGQRWIFQGADMGHLRFTDSLNQTTQWIEPQDAELYVRLAPTWRTP